jgi:ADP-ribose pyrophosphatase
VGSSQLLAGFFTSPGFTTEYMYLYAAGDLQPGEPTEQTDELQIVHVTQEEALESMRAGQIADAKTMLALLFYDMLMEA